MQSELFGQDEPPCPGYDVCPVKLCGCRWLGLGTPFASDVKKGTIYADSALHGNDDAILLTHREAITQTENGDAIMTTFTTANGTVFTLAMNASDISATARGLTFSVVFDGKNVESRFLIREAGNNKIVAPVPAANLAEVSAMFEKLAANIAARMADDAEYDAHVAGVKKMMNA